MDYVEKLTTFKGMPVLPSLKYLQVDHCNIQSLEGMPEHSQL